MVMILISQNIMFMLTVFGNPGMIPRNPNLHSAEYLKSIGDKEINGKICDKCQVIIPKGAKKVVHCDDCNVCVSNYDHHCVWCSKCIAGGNLYFFSCFLLLTVAGLLCFWFNLVSLLVFGIIQ